jgi:hypothetical protein
MPYRAPTEKSPLYILYIHVTIDISFNTINELDKPNAWGYNLATQSLGEINKET